MTSDATWNSSPKARPAGAGCMSARPGERRPTVVLAGGWCYVREIVMPTYAEAFAEAGFNALVFDYRNLGVSDGDDRQHLDPVGAGPRLPERGELPRAPRRGRSEPHRRLGHLLFRRPCPDPRRDRPAGQDDRLPDPGRRRLREHAPRPRHDGVPGAVEADPRGPEAPLRERASGSTCRTRSPTRTRKCRPGRSRRRCTTFMEIKASHAPLYQNRSTVESVDLLMQYDVGPFVKRIYNTPTHDDRRRGRRPDAVGPRDRRLQPDPDDQEEAPCASRTRRT